jgi:hypothetical protein
MKKPVYICHHIGRLINLSTLMYKFFFTPYVNITDKNGLSPIRLKEMFRDILVNKYTLGTLMSEFIHHCKHYKRILHQPLLSEHISNLIFRAPDYRLPTNFLPSPVAKIMFI